MDDHFKSEGSFGVTEDATEVAVPGPVVLPRLTAGMPHAHFVRGPTPETVLVEEASYKVAAPGDGLSAVPAAREAFYETGHSWRSFFRISTAPHRV